MLSENTKKQRGEKWLPGAGSDGGGNRKVGERVQIFSYQMNEI